MFRRLMLTMLLVVAIVSVSQLTWAAAAPLNPEGEYAVVGGKTTLALNVALEGKKLITITVTLYDLSLAQLFGTMTFGPEALLSLENGTGGAFDIRQAQSDPADPLPPPLLSGTWIRTNPTSFRVEADLEELLGQLNTYLVDMGMEAVKSERSYFTGKMSLKNGIKTISGKYSLVIDLQSDGDINVRGTSLVFSGSFVAVPAEEVMLTALAVSHAPTISNPGRLSQIKDFAKSLAEQIRRETARAGQN